MLDRDDDIKDFKDSFIDMYNRKLLLGYDLKNSNESIVTCPSIEFIEKMKLEKISLVNKLLGDNFNCLLEKAQNESLETRLFLGLNLYRNDEEEIKKLQKSIEISN